MCSEEKVKQMENLVLMRKAVVELYNKIKYITVNEKLMCLRIQSMSTLERRKQEVADCSK